ncbi:MAG: response regulator [Myxococcaceae bacterium]
MSVNTTEEVPLATGHASTGRGSSEKRTAEVRETVLVVEDDPAHRELLVEMLSLWGYDPVPVGSAEEAEYVARKKLLDAAIVDVFLPGKSGTTVMTKLREKFPDLILIGVSAMSDSTMARKCKALGADLFIGKPVAMEDLANALQSKHKTWH